MSLYGEEIINRLSGASGLQDSGNAMRKLIDDGVGGWLDRFDEDSVAEQVFLESATGSWLDVHGRCFNVPRKLGELDDDYRSRIVYEAMGHLTSDYLRDVYGVELFVGDTYDEVRNVLVSDNVFVNGKWLMGLVGVDVQGILNRKFLLDNIVFWIRDGRVDYIFDTDGVNVINDYLEVYDITNGKNYFYGNDDLESVRLYLTNLTDGYSMFYGCSGLTSIDLDFPNPTNGSYMFYGCSGLTSVSLDLPNLTNGYSMFYGCSGLTSVSLDLPNLTNGGHMFHGCSGLTSVSLDFPNLTNIGSMFLNCPSLEYINLTIPTNRVTNMITYIQGLNLQYLETLIINDEVIPI